jgi:quinohemoprotein amine dehydrogenase
VLTPSSVDLGPGVKVTRVISSAPESALIEVDVAADASIGERDIFAAGVKGQSGIVIYDKIDGIRVLPKAGMARIGGIAFPKQYQQFEAVAYNNGPDGKPETKDDLTLGPVDVGWSLEEFTATFGDDDKEFVGTIDAMGLFTPNVDGPNPKRRNNTNNYGDVWVVATYRPPAGSKDSKPIRARAHLLVTVPLYMKFDQPEVAR